MQNKQIMKDLHKPADSMPPRPSRRKTVLDYVCAEEKRRQQQRGQGKNLIIETLNKRSHK